MYAAWLSLRTRLRASCSGSIALTRVSGRRGTPPTVRAGLGLPRNGGDQQIFYVTPGYRLIGLSAKTGQRLPQFGEEGVVDLMENMDQDIDPVAGEIGLHATP